MGLKIVFTELPNFSYLETSEDIGRIQEILYELGYDIGRSGVDKVFGDDTRQALAEFIRLGKVKQNGSVGEKTLFALTEHTVNKAGFVPLSWEKFHPERQEWSSYVFGTVGALFDSSFPACGDITRFRSDYDALSRQQKINVWGELICAICKFESGWKPTAWMKEPMGTDPVTGKQVRSEGLMQLSYQDKPNYPKLPCRFDWSADKDLNENDPTKTIFNPEINLEFGINILAEQIRKHRRIALSKNVYWAVIKDGGKYQRINEIIAIVEKLQL